VAAAAARRRLLAQGRQLWFFRGRSTQERSSPPEETPQLKRLMYHAKQRGWLELDLIIGNWAEQNRKSLASDAELTTEFENLLAVENPDLFKYLTGQMEPDDAMLKSNTVFKMIRQHVMDQYGRRDHTVGSGKEWLRSGWHDK
jgi:succinate dehydrogenase flavin-adding protein (antitoxin of CptAB toxin-antitoxin module)